MDSRGPCDTRNRSPQLRPVWAWGYRLRPEQLWRTRVASLDTGQDVHYGTKPIQHHQEQCSELLCQDRMADGTEQNQHRLGPQYLRGNKRDDQCSQPQLSECRSYGLDQLQNWV